MCFRLIAPRICGIALCASVAGLSGVHAQTFTRLFDAGDLTTGQPGGTGAAWADYNLDGFVDLFIASNPGQLYRNNGDATFTSVQVSHMTTFSGNVNSAVWTDVNNDGNPDLFVSHLGPGTPVPPGGQLNPRPNFLYINQGPPSFGFSRITEGDLTSTQNMTWTSSFSDYDNDGDVDLFVWGDQGDEDLFYKNDGTGSFASVSGLPFLKPGAFSAGGQLADMDGDGDQDILVVNFMRTNNELYRNLLTETGTASFEAVTEGAIVFDNEDDLVASWGDVDNDGDLDVFMSVWNNRNNSLYLNEGNLEFTRVAAGPHVSDGGFSLGNVMFDYDNDGDLDIYVIQQQGVDRLYRNEGDGTFVKMTGDDVGDIISLSGAGSDSGTAVADVDNDGDLDVVNPTFGSAHKLFRNDIGQDNHWLKIDLVGVQSNRLGIGAVVRAKAAMGDAEEPVDVWQMRMMHGGPTGDRAQSHQRIHFGFGDTSTIDSLRIEWPSGAVDVLTNVQADQLLEIEEGSHPESVGVDTPHELPSLAHIGPNWPNPFDRRTQSTLTLERTARVGVTVIDPLGRVRETRTLGWLPPGDHTVQWPVAHLAAGTYAFRVDVSEGGRTRSLVRMATKVD